MAGKWSKFKDKIEKFEEPMSDFRAKVLQAKVQMDESLELNSEVAVVYRSYRQQKDELETQVKELNVMIEAAEELALERMEQDGVSSFKLSDGTLFYESPEPYVQVEDQEVVLDWAKREAPEAITVQPAKLRAIVKEMLLDMQPNPPGTKVFMKNRLVMKKG